VQCDIGIAKGSRVSDVTGFYGKFRWHAYGVHGVSFVYPQRLRVGALAWLWVPMACVCMTWTCVRCLIDDGVEHKYEEWDRRATDKTLSTTDVMSIKCACDTANNLKDKLASMPGIAVSSLAAHNGPFLTELIRYP